jgi:hypothetical protein
VLIKAQKKTIIKLPTIGLAKPPPSDPGAGVLAKNRDGLIAAKPFHNKMAKIQKRNSMPIDMAIMEKVRPRAFARFRFANNDGSRVLIRFSLLDLLPSAST